MGSGFSKGNSVFFQADKPVYQDGDFVQGVVCLNIVKPVTITSIDCQLQGHERTYWTEQRESGTGSHRSSWTEQHGGTVQLLSVTHPLQLKQNEFSPGQYQWNVVFGLPRGLPSSFRIGSGSDGAEVAYSVNLTFHTPGMFTSAIRSSQQLTVHQRLAVPPSVVDQSVERQLTWCCCFGQGLLRAHVRVERDEVQPGQEVAAILEVDNQARAAVKRVEVCLKQECVALERVGGGGDRRRWHREHARADHPGVQPFTTLQGGMARRMSLRLPAPLPPSMRGSLITCAYFAKVSLKCGLGTREVKLKVPLVVLAPQPEATQEEPFFSEAPPFWSPAAAAAVEAIDVPSAPPLPPELLRPDAPFWTRAASNKSADSLAEPLLGNGTKYDVV